MCVRNFYFFLLSCNDSRHLMNCSSERIFLIFPVSFLIIFISAFSAGSIPSGSAFACIERHNGRHSIIRKCIFLIFHHFGILQKYSLVSLPQNIIYKCRESAALRIFFPDMSTLKKTPSAIVISKMLLNLIPDF